MCALLYDATDFRSKKLHEFNQYVKNDNRVEQVILTIREGITMIKPIATG
jgi:predicted O-methyltransferase YrrM